MPRLREKATSPTPMNLTNAPALESFANKLYDFYEAVYELHCAVDKDPKLAINFETLDNLNTVFVAAGEEMIAFSAGLGRQIRKLEMKSANAPITTEHRN
jgi:hypothetical protein